jgi:dUTP pyrophosphatase
MNDAVTVLVKKVHPDAKVPEYQTAGAAGVDLHAVMSDGYEEITIYPDEFKVIWTGLAIQLPPGYEAQIRPRSGLAAKKGISIVNTPGTVDEDYRGVIGVTLINHGREKLIVKSGDRIAQMVVMPVPRVEFIEVKALGDTERGAGGMGSTGVSS